MSAYRNPSKFQVELKIVIEKYCQNISNPSVIEIGSSFGTTTAILPTTFKKTLVDFSANTLDKAQQLFNALGQEVTLLTLNILDSNQPKYEYDIVFSAGLLEHFTLTERRKAITNMFRSTKNGGVMIIAIPNHYSLPYRIGYMYSVLMHKWIYPREFKIKNFQKETKNLSGIQLVERLNLDKANIYSFLPKTLSIIFRHLDRWLKFEEYLSVFIYKKTEDY